jgi:hypothetical protein
MTWPSTLFAMITGVLRSRAALEIENPALRHQLGRVPPNLSSASHPISRPHLLVVAVPPLAGMAGGAGHCPARDRDRLATEEVP